MPLSSAKFALKIHTNQVAKQDVMLCRDAPIATIGERVTHGLWLHMPVCSQSLN